MTDPKDYLALLAARKVCTVSTHPHKAWDCLLTMDEFFEAAEYDKEVQFYALSIRSMSVGERINLQPEEGPTYIIRVK